MLEKGQKEQLLAHDMYQLNKEIEEFKTKVKEAEDKVADAKAESRRNQNLLEEVKSEHQKQLQTLEEKLKVPEESLKVCQESHEQEKKVSEDRYDKALDDILEKEDKIEELTKELAEQREREAAKAKAIEEKEAKTKAMLEHAQKSVDTLKRELEATIARGKQDNLDIKQKVKQPEEGKQPSVPASIDEIKKALREVLQEEGPIEIEGDSHQLKEELDVLKATHEEYLKKAEAQEKDHKAQVEGLENQLKEEKLEKDRLASVLKEHEEKLQALEIKHKEEKEAIMKESSGQLDSALNSLEENKHKFEALLAFARGLIETHVAEDKKADLMASLEGDLKVDKPIQQIKILTNPDSEISSLGESED